MKKIISKIIEVLTFNKIKQTTFIYCPKCRNELIYNGNLIEDNDGIIKHKCSKCGDISFWDFMFFPLPILRTCADCKYLKKDKFGAPHCDEEYSPDTQEKFIYKTKENIND